MLSATGKIIQILFGLMLCATIVSCAGIIERRFAQWLETVRIEARTQGISATTINQTLDNIERDPRVIKLDRNQPEFKDTFTGYIEKRLSAARIETGRERLVEHRQLLDDIYERYKIDPEFLVAIWGLESNYGDYPLSYDVIRSLLTLAFDKRRSAFFRAELFAALRIIEQGHIEIEHMKGSWAGAMGQPQFMPSSFIEYAVDFNGDGQKNIWHDQADVLASIANYLKNRGDWQTEQPWGERVELPENIELLRNHIESKQWLPTSQWQTLGIISNHPTDAIELNAMLVNPDEETKEAYLVYPNFKTLYAYNRSNYYVLSVCLLADELANAMQNQSDEKPIDAETAE